MSLVPPILDDRRFEDLRAEALERIQREFPDWTDFNASDPGITLVELFAWFTELMLFRMNQLPDKLHGELLHLLGMRPEPAHAATAVIEFRPDPQKNDETLKPQLPDAVVIPRHAQSERISLDDGKDVVFETEEELAVVRRPLVAIQRRVRANKDNAELTLLNDLADRGYDPFGTDGAEQSELRLRIKVLPDDRLDDVFPEIVTLHVALTEPPPGSRSASTGSMSAAGAKLVWEARLADLDDTEQWERLEIVGDESASFTRDGFIRLGRPHYAVAHNDDKDKTLAIELRCRVEKAFAFGRAPRLRHLSINAVTARAYGTEKEQDLGVSNGLSGQSFILRKQPVEPGSVRLITRQGEQTERSAALEWNEVADFANARAEKPGSKEAVPDQDRRVFMLDPASGRITFGDGEYGEIPTAGQRVVALSYRTGGGSFANVNAKAIKFQKPKGFTGINPLAAGGGRDAEPANALRQRAPARLRSRDRAVTAGDYEAIARAEGGMARAFAVPGLHPDFPELEGQMPGALTVFVVAPLFKDNRAPPLPTNLELELVEQVLDQRRMIGSEVHVRAARVIPVRVTLSVHRAAGIGAEKAIAAIRKAVNAFLNDSERGFGAKIHAAEVWSAALQAKDQDRPVIQQIRGLVLNAEGVGMLSLQQDEDTPNNKSAEGQVKSFVAGDVNSDKFFVRLPSHAVPWGPEAQRVYFVEDRP